MYQCSHTICSEWSTVLLPALIEIPSTLSSVYTVHVFGMVGGGWRMVIGVGGYGLPIFHSLVSTFMYVFQGLHLRSKLDACGV